MRRVGDLDRVVVEMALHELGWQGGTVVQATSASQRLLGMIAHGPLDGEGMPLVLILPLCSSVHTCFMGYPLDIAFIDSEGNVLGVDRGIGPWRIRSWPGAVAVLERASLLRPRASSGAVFASARC